MLDLKLELDWYGAGGLTTALPRFHWRIACRRAEINGKPAPPQPAPPKPLEDGKPAPEVKLPDHPLLDLLGTMTLPEIEHWLLLMQRQDRMQQNPQLGEVFWVAAQWADDREEKGLLHARLYLTEVALWA